MDEQNRDQELQLAGAMAPGDLDSRSEKGAAPPKKKAQDLKKKPQKKPNFFVRTGKKISKWFRDLKSEAKKVVWPTSKQVLNNTIVVLIVAVLVWAFVAILDFTFGFLRDLLLTLL